MKNILVIGKNSYYFSRVKIELGNEYNVYEIRHNDFSNTDLHDIDFFCILIFSRVNDPKYFILIKEKYKFNNIILISSIILNLPNTFRLYGYYQEKANVEKWFISVFQNFTKLLIIRSGTIEDNNSLIYSKKNDFIKAIKNMASSDFIISLPIYYKDFNLPCLFYRFIFKLPFGYIILRPFDIYYKRMNKYVYGYIYAISKYLKINP